MVASRAGVLAMRQRTSSTRRPTPSGTLLVASSLTDNGNRAPPASGLKTQARVYLIVYCFHLAGSRHKTDALAGRNPTHPHPTPTSMAWYVFCGRVHAMQDRTINVKVHQRRRAHVTRCFAKRPRDGAEAWRPSTSTLARYVARCAARRPRVGAEASRDSLATEA